MNEILRQAIIKWLEWNDPEQPWSDEKSKKGGFPPMSLCTAIGMLYETHRKTI